jgi:hypothetical protein
MAIAMSLSLVSLVIGLATWVTACQISPVRDSEIFEGLRMAMTEFTRLQSLVEGLNVSIWSQTPISASLQILRLRMKTPLEKDFCDASGRSLKESAWMPN